MQNLVLLDSLRELVTLIGDSIRLALSESHSQEAEADVDGDILETCRGGIEAIAMAAENVQLTGMYQLCVRVHENLGELPGQEMSKDLGTLLTSWIEALQTYVQQPETQGITTSLLSLIPEQHRDTVRVALQADLTTAPEPEPTPEVEEVEETTQQPETVLAEDVLLIIDPEVKPKLVAVFFQEVPANAAKLTEHLTQVVRGENLVKNLAASQRLAHNIKGSASLLGIKGLANLTHHLEDILEFLTEQQTAPSPALAKTLQEAADCLEQMLEALQGIAPAPENSQRILQQVLTWAKHIRTGQLEIPSEYTPQNITTPVELTAQPPEQSTKIPTTVHTTSPVVQEEAGTMLRVPPAAIDNILQMVGEISIGLDQIQERVRLLRRRSNELQIQDGVIQRHRFELENFIDVRHLVKMQHNVNRPRGFDPLELDYYDELYSTTRGFIETVMDARRIDRQLNGDLGGLEHFIVPLQRLKRNLQNSILQVRMESVASLSARLQRSVRQACRVTDKHAELRIIGEDTRLDSEILANLADPLMHVLRNAIDHGIETPAQRLAKNKPAIGTIQLRFSQVGQYIVVECNDDGQGLDYDNIKRTAIARGMAIETATRQELARLIVTPGFSTRTEVTQLSGRGVGLDVVQEAVRNLKGLLEIGDSPQGGCQIILRLPVTLVTIHSLIVQINGQLFAIPTGTIIRVFSRLDGRVVPVGTHFAYETDTATYPITALAMRLGLIQNESEKLKTELAVLLTHCDVGPMVVAVDQVISLHQSMLQDLGHYIPKVRGIFGLATLSDGRLIPILDLPELLRTSTKQPVTSGTISDMAPVNATTANIAPQIMIVDDSLSVRQTLANLMEEAGYQPQLARDGMEAIELLRAQLPALMLCDIEMPHMNGLELVTYIRTTYGNNLPIIMITSRTMQKHRQYAEQAGANDYVTKPFAEDALLEKIRNLLSLRQ